MEHFALGYNEKSGFSRAIELPARRRHVGNYKRIIIKRKQFQISSG
jgi:hypothetical protein